MNGKTTLLLLLLVCLLGGAIWFQGEKEQKLRNDERDLFAGVRLERVQTIRVDNLERSYNMRLERDTGGRWYLTDPLNYPADVAVLKLIFDDIRMAKAMGVPLAEQGEKELGFDPPKVILELDEKLENGELKTFVLEIGAEDLDGIRLNVRANGDYLRCLVRLYTTLNQDVNDFRSKQPLVLGAESIIGVSRSGLLQRPGEELPEDLALVAYRDGDNWVSVKPRAALLGTLDIGIMIVHAIHMKVMGFVDDAVRDLAAFGLDRPACRIELKSSSGDSETLLLGRKGGRSPWYMTREGAPFVWSITDESAARLMLSFDEMVDLRFMRALRSHVNLVELQHGEMALRLVREPVGWSVARKIGEGEYSAPLRGDGQRIDELLGQLEDLELHLLPTGAGAEQPKFLATGSVAVEIGPLRLGGEFAPTGDADQVLFRRFGAELLLLAPEWLAGAAATPLADLRSMQLTSLTENAVRALRITRGESQLVFERDSRGLWHQSGVAAEATQLLPLVDAMVYLKAAKFLPGDSPAEGGIEVLFTPFEGDPTRFRVFSDGAGGSLAEVGGSLAELKVAGLYGLLSGLF